MATNFNKMMELENILMIVDSLNLAFRYKHSKARYFVDDYKRTVESLRKSYKAKYVVIASDQGSSSYRKNLYSEYKQNRKDKQELSTEQEQLEFKLFFEEYLAVIDSYNEDGKYPVFRFDKCEADDIGAYIVKVRKKYPHITKIVLVSSDRDWDLLIDLDVMRFSYVTRKEVTVDNYNEHYEWNPEEYISIKCLQGDSGDNVPGVDGIGPKKAMALVREYGTAYDIAANLPIKSKYKYIAKLNEFGSDAILLNYRLMDLLEFCEEALGPNNCSAIDETLSLYLNDE